MNRFDALGRSPHPQAQHIHLQARSRPFVTSKWPNFHPRYFKRTFEVKIMNLSEVNLAHVQD
jgi:hypothetical protein